MPKGIRADRYAPTVCGVACLGEKYKGHVKVAPNKWIRLPEYVLWKNIINRCYNPNSWKTSPHYEGCSVSERWLCYENFVDDLDSIEGVEFWRQGLDYELDKDLRIPGNKVYSLEACSFVHSSVNGSDGGKRSTSSK